MGRRSRKRSVHDAPGARPAPADQAPAERPRRLRGEERDALARESLTPLAPGERPGPLKAAALTAAVIALLNVVNAALELAGVDTDTGGSTLARSLLLAAGFAVVAWGLWNTRYWAALGFQGVLALAITFSALSLLVAANVAAVVLCVAIMGLGGWLFWKLVRVLGRMKAPAAPGAAARERAGR